MTVPVQELLHNFDALPESDKHEAAVAILRRYATVLGDVPDDALLQAADELFVALEEEEASHAPS